MNLNLKAKNESKQLLAVHIYKSDYDYMQAFAKEQGMKLSDFTRTLINNFIDSEEQ